VPLIPPVVMTTESAWLVEDNNGGGAIRAWYAALERSTAMFIQTGALRASRPEHGQQVPVRAASWVRVPRTAHRRHAHEGASGKRLTGL
jgi:hypothetical protein